MRPEDKRAKKKAKRLANPLRQGYSSILTNANANRDSSPSSLTTEQRPPTADGKNVEAEAVAKAIGLNEEAFGAWRGFSKEDIVGVPLGKVQTSSARSEAGMTEDSPSPEGPLVLDEWEGEGMEDIPEMERLGSPVVGEGDEDEIKPLEKELGAETKGKGGDLGSGERESAEEKSDLDLAGKPLAPIATEQREDDTTGPKEENSDISLADKPTATPLAEEVENTNVERTENANKSNERSGTSANGAS